MQPQQRLRAHTPLPYNRPFDPVLFAIDLALRELRPRTPREGIERYREYRSGRRPLPVPVLDAERHVLRPLGTAPISPAEDAIAYELATPQLLRAPLEERLAALELAHRLARLRPDRGTYPIPPGRFLLLEGERGLALLAALSFLEPGEVVPASALGVGPEALAFLLASRALHGGVYAVVEVQTQETVGETALVWRA